MVNLGGSLVVSAGGSAVGTQVNSGGSAGIAYQGSGTNLTVTAGGQAAIGGTLTGGTLDGNVLIELGGTMSDGEIDGDAKVQVADRANISGVDIYVGGNLQIEVGGKSYNISVETGGTLAVTNSTDTRAVLNGGTETVGTQGNAIGGTIKAGGYQSVASGGTASGTVIDAGGVRTVGFRGLASGSTVQNGGIQVISARGMATGTILAVGRGTDLTSFSYTSAGMATVNSLNVLTVTMRGADLHQDARRQHCG